MGSFSINEDNFKHDRNDKPRVHSKQNINIFGINFNKNTIYIISVGVFIVIINVILFFYFFHKSDSIIEIPDNSDFKEYCENNISKDKNIYKLLSQKKVTTQKPIVVEVEEDDKVIVQPNVIQESLPKPANSNDDKIDFNNIRSLNINNENFNNKSVGQRILDIDNTKNIGGKVYRLNVGVFFTHELAEEYIQKLKKNHQIFSNITYYVLPIQLKKKILYKALIGDFNDESDAESFSEKLESIEVNNTVEEF